MASMSNRVAWSAAATLFATAMFAPLAIGDEGAPPGSTVATDAGRVRGLLVGPDRDVVAFKGTPYAKPPVGELRWREPRPAEKWEGVRDCFRFGNACPQRVDSTLKTIPQLALNAESNREKQYDAMDRKSRESKRIGSPSTRRD
jgi:hypothetical protein